MSRFQKSAFAVVLAAIILFPGCFETETTTTIHPDGTMDRVVIITGDSASLYSGTIPIAIDSTWDKKIERINGLEHYKLTASKTFSSTNAMNEAIRGTFGVTQQSQSDLQTRFRFFYTTYEYHETIFKSIMFDTVPITDYIPHRMIDIYVHHEVDGRPFATANDSIALADVEPRFQEWASRNKFEAVFALFMNSVSSLNDPALTEAMVTRMKDSLLHQSLPALKKGNIDTLQHIFLSFLKRPPAAKAWQNISAQVATMQREEERPDLGSFAATVIMPGTIISSNARVVNGDKASWKNYSDIAKIMGYTMTVQSRVIHWWAIVLSGLLILGALILFLRARPHSAR